MNKADLDYIIEKINSYKLNSLYNDYDSENENRDQRVTKLLDSIISKIENDYKSGNTPMPKEWVLNCKLDKEQMEELKRKNWFYTNLEPVEENQWIKCSEKMPENGKDVLVVIKEDEYTDICVGETYGEGNWLINGEFWYEKSDPAITHWMPSPKPPEEEEK